MGDYRIDQAMVNRPEAIGHLMALIQKVLESSPHGKIHLVGFSMGTYLLTRALMELVDRGQDLSRIGAVILISADIDAQDFKDLYFPKLKKALGGRLVLYVSGRDKALVLSSDFHRGRPRLGQGGGRVAPLEGVTTIDATQSSPRLRDLPRPVPNQRGESTICICRCTRDCHPGKRLLDPYEKNRKRYYSLFF